MLDKQHSKTKTISSSMPTLSVLAMLFLCRTSRSAGTRATLRKRNLRPRYRHHSNPYDVLARRHQGQTRRERHNLRYAILLRSLFLSGNYVHTIFLIKSLLTFSLKTAFSVFAQTWSVFAPPKTKVCEQTPEQSKETITGEKNNYETTCQLCNEARLEARNRMLTKNKIRNIQGQHTQSHDRTSIPQQPHHRTDIVT